MSKESNFSLIQSLVKRYISPKAMEVKLHPCTKTVYILIRPYFYQLFTLAIMPRTLKALTRNIESPVRDLYPPDMQIIIIFKV